MSRTARQLRKDRYMTSRFRQMAWRLLMNQVRRNKSGESILFLFLFILNQCLLCDLLATTPSSSFRSFLSFHPSFYTCQLIVFSCFDCMFQKGVSRDYYYWSDLCHSDLPVDPPPGSGRKASGVPRCLGGLYASAV